MFYTCFTDTSKEKDKIDKLESTQLTLIKSDAFLHLITQQISDVIFLADMNLKTNYITKSIEYLTDDTPDEFLARPLQQIRPPETLALLQRGLAEEPERDGQPDDTIKVNESVRAARSQKIPITLEYRSLSATDEWVWLEDKSSVIHAQGNEVVVEGIIRDITQGKQDQIHIRKLLSVVEQSPVSIVITNLDAAIEYVNPHFTYISGYRPGKGLGKKPRILQSRKSAHVNDYRGLWKTIKEGKTWKGEFVNQKKNGEEYWEQATIAPLTNEEGKTTHYIAVEEDITDRKKQNSTYSLLQSAWSKSQSKAELSHLTLIFMVNSYK